MESKAYYKEVIKDYLKQNHHHLFTELKKDNELEGVLEWRAKHFLEQMERSSNPQDEKELYYQDMLTF